MKTILTILIGLLLGGIMAAQEPESSELYKTILEKDTYLFENGFNKCDRTANEKIIHEDLEFYHDLGGFSQGKAAFIENFMKNMCDQNKKPIRKIVNENNEIYPLTKNGVIYGAIQKGVHEFYIQEPGKELYKTQVAKFTHVWVKENENWQIKRVLSYDHQTPQLENGKHIVASEILLSYAGNYKAPQTGAVTISIANGIMHLSAGKMQADLVAKSDTKFAHPQAPFALEFVTAPNGSVSKFKVVEKGVLVEEALRID